MIDIQFFPTQNIILQIGGESGISLYFYGAMYALSALCSYFFTEYWVGQKNMNTVKSDDIIDIIFWSFFSGVMGGRLGYMLIYNFDNFIADPFSLVQVWNGGMSIHGGLIGGAIGYCVIAKIKKIDLWKFADISVVSIAFGMALGRLGNFMNKELVGRVTDVSWAMDFGDGLMRHPSQLYAVGKDIILFFLFWYMLKKTAQKSGIIFAWFLMLYAIFRFCVEFFRAPDPQLGFVFLQFSMGQMLSIALFMIGMLLYAIRLFSRQQ